MSQHPLSSLEYTSLSPIGRDQQKKLTQIINNLIDMPQSVDFLTPVPWKQLGLDDYLDVIQHPMHLYKVQENLKNKDYQFAQEALDHIQLIWDNCKEYNPEGHFYQLAVKMEKALRKMIKNYLPLVQIAVGVVPKIIAAPISQSKKPSNLVNRLAVQLKQTKQIKKQMLQLEQSESPEYQQQLMQQSQQVQPQIQQISSSQKTRLYSRLKQVTQQQLAQIVLIIQDCCSEGFKTLGNGRCQIQMDSVDTNTFRKIMDKLDQFADNQKLNNNAITHKKVKI